MFDGDFGVGGLFAFGIEFRGGEVDVVGLPAEGRVTHVDFGNGDFVEAATFVVFAFEAEAVEHLDFISSLEVDAAVTAFLAAPGGGVGEAEFEMEGEVVEEVGAGGALREETVFRDVGFDEAVDVFAVEENLGTGWRGCVEGGGFTGDAVELHEAFAVGIGDEDLVAVDFTDVFFGPEDDSGVAGIAAALAAIDF